MPGLKDDDNRGGAEYWKWSGLGFEFAAVTGLFFYFGYLVDERWGCGPWGFLIGGGIGLVGGVYLLAKEGLKMMNDLDRPRDPQQGQRSGRTAEPPASDADRLADHRPPARPGGPQE